MLNVPESVKTLYKTDGTRKNFRVHFPNGEMEDITNDNIVRESLHFTESVCSQSVFRFGLAEASVIEFETVGVGNMFGMTIECSIEIDTTSLSSAEISAIQSGTWDGSLVLASASDIGFGFFRIPLGLFRVDKCPRNHGAMTHRQVTAYSVGLAENSITSSFERWKMNAVWAEQTLHYNLPILMDSNLYSQNASVVDSKYTKTYIAPITASATFMPFQMSVPGGILQVSAANYRTVTFPAPAQNNPPYLYSVSVRNFSDRYARQFVTDTLASFNLSDQTDKVLLKMQELLTIRARISGAESGSGDRFYQIAKSEPILYMPNEASRQDAIIVSAPQYYVLTITFRPTVGAERSESRPIDMGGNMLFDLYKLTPRTTPNDSTIAIESTGDTGGTVRRYTYSLAYNITDLLRGWLELTGEFGTENRGRGFEQFALSPDNPVIINPGNYDEAWWDEYDVDAIGTVSLTFKNGDEEVTASVFLGNGSSVYDMTDNEALKMLDGLTLDGIVELLNGEFAQNAEEVGFTPAEITMQGWPWIEAGDALRITAEDGTVIDTYALRVELSGVQNLSAYIVSEGGEIIGEV